MLFWTLQRVFACYALLFYSAIFIYVDFEITKSLISEPLIWVLIILQISRHSALGMTVGFHRYYSHGAFKTKRRFELFIAYCCAASNQGAMSWWAANHRYHHIHCDDDKDPHSPLTHSFLYSWLGWGYDPKHAHRTIKLRYPEIEWVDNWCFLVPWLEWGVIWFFSDSLAFATLISLLPAALSPIGTLFFNSLSHGGEPDANGCAARRYWQLSAILLGEHEHRYHHIHPTKAKRPGPDLPYWLVIWPLKKMGVIWDVK